MKTIILWLICVGFSAVSAFLHRSGGLSVPNKLQLQTCTLQTRKHNSRPFATKFSSPDIKSIALAAPPFLSKLSLLAYDTAYSVNKENLRGKFKDHKYFRYLYYDFDQDEIYWGVAGLVLYFVLVRTLGLWDSILTLLGFKKTGSGGDMESNIMRVWYQFTGQMKTDEEKKKQLLNTLTENDFINKRPATETFECEKCRMQLMPAKGRATFIMGKPTFRCARCGSKASAYFNINDMDDERAIARKARLENEELGLGEDGEELDYSEHD